MPLVFQYGSNTNTPELYNRLGSRPPDLGCAQTVDTFEIAFNKRSINRGCATGDLIGPNTEGGRIWGVLYKMSEPELEKLVTDIEGPSYEPLEIQVEDASGEVKTATTFVVRERRRRDGLWTSFEYVRLIVNGLRAHGVEEVDPAYIQHVIDVAIVTNNRAAETATEQTRQIESLRTTS